MKNTYAIRIPSDTLEATEIALSYAVNECKAMSPAERDAVKDVMRQCRAALYACSEQAYRERTGQ